MLTINASDCRFAGAGYFTTEKEWIHPVRCEETYKLIYVTDGFVCLESGGQRILLKKGSLIILRPGILHRGYEKSVGKTSFYSLSLYIDNPDGLPYLIEDFNDAHLFEELLRHINTPGTPDLLKTGIILHLMGQIYAENELQAKPNGRLGAEISEWIRINADAEMTVKKVAEHFGYNPEYLSRVIKNNYNTGIKALIDGCIIKKANNYLLNTSYSVKDISEILKFSDANLFTNFYKYHEHTVPLKYRNSAGNK